MYAISKVMYAVSFIVGLTLWSAALSSVAYAVEASPFPVHVAMQLGFERAESPIDGFVTGVERERRVGFEDQGRLTGQALHLG